MTGATAALLAALSLHPADLTRETQADRDLLAAIVWVESRGRDDVVSRAGATGRAQVMPRMARKLCRDLLAAGPLHHPTVNIACARRVIAEAKRVCGCRDVRRWLCGYNTGRCLDGCRYSRAVLSVYRKIRRGGRLAS